MFESSGDHEKFKLVLRDFLISIKEFSGTDTADLFVEDKETEVARKAQEEREAASKVPVSALASDSMLSRTDPGIVTAIRACSNRIKLKTIRSYSAWFVLEGGEAVRRRSRDMYQLGSSRGFFALQ